MLFSMTGFGNDIYSTDRYTLETEVKSLNSRYLDLSIRLPKEINQHEFAIRDLVKNKLTRGKISVSLNISLNNSSTNNISLNNSELDKVVNLFNNVKESINSNEDISISQLLEFKDYFVNQTDNAIEIDIQQIIKSLNRAIDNLIEMRGQEGSQLKIDLISRLEVINNTLGEIEALAKNSTTEYFEKFKEKAKRLSDEFVDDMDRFLLELGILSEKHDVTEECIRLHSHIKLFNDTLLKSNDVGRKLNFICQEMNREVNTINSKSISTKISHLGIIIKEELEKIREQVQNIE